MKKMEKFMITEEQHQLYKKFLKVEDIEAIAELASQEKTISTSTLYNVVNRKYPVNERTSHAISVLNVYLYIKLNELYPLINVYMKELEELEEVKKWIKK